MAPRSSAAVYRRRRLVVFGGLLLVIVGVVVGVWMLVAQPWASAEEAPTPTPAASDTPDPSPSATSESPTPEPSADETPSAVACTAKDIEVKALADADTYASGVLPKLSISLTNKGSKDCTINVGSTTQEFTVSSGADVWWRSTDCQANPSDMIVTLAAGQNVTSAEPVTWDRTRSSVETCAQENRPRAPGGGASYHVAVSIGGFKSASTQQILLY